jgi:anti-sigma B factor antagonist
MDAAKKTIAQLEVVDGIPVVAVEGEVDIANIRELDEQLRAAGERDAGAVVVSLEKASYFDSAAIHSLIACRARLSTSRQGFVIVQPSNPAGRRVLEIAGLLRDDTLVGSQEDALVLARQLAANHRPL